MLNDLEAAFYLQELQQLLPPGDRPPKARMFRLQYSLVSLLNALTEAQSQETFVSNYAKIHFIGEVYDLPDELLKSCYQIRALLQRNLSSRDFIPTQTEIEGGIAVLAALVVHFSGQPLPKDLQNCQALPPISPSGAPASLLPELRAVFLHKRAAPDGSPLLLVRDALDNTLQIVVRDITWGQHKIALTQNCVFLERYQSLLFTNLEHIEDQLWTTTGETFMVIEPDYLVDASAIARCFQGRTISAYFALLDRLSLFEGNAATLRGNLINELLDILLRRPQETFAQAWPEALDRYKADAARLDAQTLSSIRATAQGQFMVLQQLFGQPEAGARLRAEPSFISPRYGLQGRLDVLKTFDDQPQRKDIIELKSTGRVPDHEHIGWPADRIQIACYNLLLDSTFHHRRGVSALLYPADTLHPLRNCGPLNFEKQQALLLRNKIVRLDWVLAKGQTTTFERLVIQLQQMDLPPYKTKEVADFARVWQSADGDERAYFAAFFGLVMREQIVAKIGGVSGIEPTEGFASLWRSHPEEKANAFAILQALTIRDFDPQTMRLILLRSQAGITAFRVGDIVVLYPTTQPPSQYPLLKGSIAQLNQQTITLQLWSSYLDPALFRDTQTHWAIEPNLMEKGYQQQCAGLAYFLSAPRAKKDLLLGKQRPQFLPSIDLPAPPDLSQEQRQILQRVLSAQDYFLIQGPPGTGKTSRMLWSIVEVLYRHTEECIVLLAFTNRATDEICEKVKLVCGEDFLRLGQPAPESPFYGQSLHALPSLEQIQERLSKTRVFVSTVASFSSNVQYIPRFDTLIVDEASQLLEPHLCGVLPRFERFILIGDEKQLPAVITQSPRHCRSDDPVLRSLGIEDLSRSVFDRLLLRAKACGWDECHAMLSVQFRTHEDIAHFFNNAFYKKLTIGSPRQSEDWQWFDPRSDDPDERFLSQSRLLFRESPWQPESKLNRPEAEAVARLATTIARRLQAQDRWHEGRLGIITPYRAQIAEILLCLPTDLQEQITVDTVERYQGSERDIILLSMAVNHPAMLKNLEAFGSDGPTVDRKLNVALSRAREQLVLFGNREILSQGVFYAQLLRYIDQLTTDSRPPKAG